MNLYWIDFFLTLFYYYLQISGYMEEISVNLFSDWDEGLKSNQLLISQILKLWYRKFLSWNKTAIS